MLNIELLYILFYYIDICLYLCKHKQITNKKYKIMKFFKNITTPEELKKQYLITFGQA